MVIFLFTFLPSSHISREPVNHGSHPTVAPFIYICAHPVFNKSKINLTFMNRIRYFAIKSFWVILGFFCTFVLWESKSNIFCPALTRTGFRFKKTKNTWSSITKGIGDQKSQSVRFNDGRIKETRVYSVLARNEIQIKLETIGNGKWLIIYF